MSRVVSMLVLACLAALPAAAHASPGVDTEMVEAINAARGQSGLPPLRPSPSLTRTASGFANELMRTDSFGHKPQIGASRRFSQLGEVISIHRGWRPRYDWTVRRWLGSTGHRAVLLSGSLRYVGVGRSSGRFGRTRATIWVVQFGRL